MGESKSAGVDAGGLPMNVKERTAVRAVARLMLTSAAKLGAGSWVAQDLEDWAHRLLQRVAAEERGGSLASLGVVVGMLPWI